MKKAAEIREMNETELENYLEDIQEEYFNLRFQHATKQESNPVRLRLLRREISRVLTIMTEKKKNAPKNK